MNWIEVSLELQADLAEPAAELLSRVAPQGVAIDLMGEVATVRAWLPEDAELDYHKHTIEEGIWHLSQIQSFPEPEFKPVEEQPWEEVWKEQYQPLEVGQRLQVLPSWSDPVDSDRLAIYLEPGMAFGTGAHTTTRHCLEAIEQLVSTGSRVADLGCGSGILSIAAAIMGAEEVIALDIDSQALQLAAENVERNDVAEHVRVMQGSLAELPRSTNFDLVVANIRPTVLEEFLRDGISSFLALDGWLVMSGILEEHLPSILAGGEADRLVLEQVMATGDWRTVIFKQGR